MFARIKRSAVTLACVLAVFWAYRLLAVPFIEPAQKPKRVAATIPAEERAKIAQQQQNRLGGYARLFPPGSWELNNPHVMEGDTAKVLWQNYENLPNGQLKIWPCTVIGFPDGDAEDPASHRRVIIMHVPEYAVLQFDGEVDVSRMMVGQFQGATLHGPVAITGEATRPDGEDELYVSTRDVEMKQNVVTTPNEVDFRFGKSSGHGRKMRIEMMQADATAGSKQRGPSFSGIQTIELTYDVTMHLQPGSSGFIPGDQRGSRASINAATSPLQTGAANKNQPQPPVDIRCDGPFQFDLVSYVATFRDGVGVMRPSPTGVGPDDQLRNCDLLSVYFEPRETKPAASNAESTSADVKSDGTTVPAAGAGVSNKGDRKKSKSSSDEKGKDSTAHRSATAGIPPLEARRIEARGNPVIVDAPSNALQTRSQRLEYDIATGGIDLDANDEVWIKQQTNEAHAKSLKYEPGPNGAWLGKAESKGPGWMNVAMGNDISHRFEARWANELKMEPDGNNHRISLLGDAWASSTGQAEIAADALHIWLHETVPPNSPRGTANGRSSDGRISNTNSASGSRNGSANRAASRIQPVYMVAETWPANPNAPASQTNPAGGQADGSGRASVRIESPQFSGTVQRLEAWFRDGTLLTDAAGAGANPSVATQNGPNIIPALQNRGRGITASPANASTSAAANNSQPRHIEVRHGNLLQVWFVTQPQTDGLRSGSSATLGTSMRPENVDIQGEVSIAETSPVQGGEKPMEIIGDRVQILQANSPARQMAVLGRPAQVGGRGMTLFGPAVQMDGTTNRLWIDGAGRMTIVGTPQQDKQSAQWQSADASPAAQTAPSQPGDFMSARGTTVVDWQGDMQFDGKTARFQRDVVAQQVDGPRTQTIHTPLLEVMMHERIDFGAPRQQEGPQNRPQMELLTCHGDVLLEGREMRDGKPVSIEQMQIRNLTVNRITGELTGEGPGRLLNWALGSAADEGSQIGALPTAALGRPTGGTKQTRGINTNSGQASTGAIPTGAVRPASNDAPVGSGQAGDANREQIYFVDVQFQRGITGNVLPLHQVISFQDQVRAIYGPVPTWEARLDLDDPRGLPPRSMFVTCDQLSVSQMGPQVNGRNTREMEALGNIRLEDQQPLGDLLTAQAHRMTYSEAKNMIVLMGDGRIPAELNQQAGPAAPRNPLRANQINYWRSTGRTVLGGIEYGEGRFNPPPPPSRH